MKLALTNFSIKHPWTVVVVTFVVTALLAAQFPKVHFDNDPENMLSEKEHVRVVHHEVKEKFKLYDFVIVGIVNEQDPDGIFNVGTLARIHGLTAQLLSLRRADDGTAVVTRPGAEGNAGSETRIDLRPDGAWKRVLNVAFRHDPNRLFDEDGDSAIIAREVISPSVVDNLKQAELGALKLAYLMEAPPTSREEALSIRDDAMGNPLYRDTLVSADEKAICLYIPIREKTYSYNVASLVRRLTADWPREDRVLITGLPVAEDTFGVEMLVQMATSAPMAGVVIFLLLLLFFRRLSLIVAPMLLAVISILCTMGLLIGLGFDVHIMSSMIAIFLMPIAVADSVHILSEFFDVYHRFNDKAQTVRHVIGHLFMPMLYTSLTTVAGFASLGTTPIPPVRVFGLHVAFGVALAWVLTMTFIPAFIMIAVPEKSLGSLRSPAEHRADGSPGLNRTLEWLGGFSYRRWRAILFVTLAVIAVSIYGITRIQVNDNPVKWFTREHPIRVADRVLNAHFGGTYTAYLTLAAPRVDVNDCVEKAAVITREVKARFAQAFPTATKEFLAGLEILKQEMCNVTSCDPKACFVRLVAVSEELDQKATSAWNELADEINYMETDGLTFEGLLKWVRSSKAGGAAERQVLIDRLQGAAALGGDELRERALAVCDEFTKLSFRNFAFEMEAELTAPLFKRPVMLQYVDQLQKHLAGLTVVGKSSSAVDALKKASYELQYVAPPADASDGERADFQARNDRNFSVPRSAAAVGQVFTQLEGMKKKDSLFHLVTKDYQEANLWVQLKSGDNKDMEHVVAAVRQYMASHPAPTPLKGEWAGLTYLNVVWQDKMVKGMLSALGSSFVVVLVMMIVLFRSPLFGVLSMIPLTVTIAFIYGLIGLVGKDYDMPVAVLSSLTLGLSVDFAIHFLERARELQKQRGSWRAASVEMFKEPAVAISRNAITISVGFTPLLLAPLVPYKTVGFFLATIMAVSWLGTLFILPALLTMLEGVLFKTTSTQERGTEQ